LDAVNWSGWTAIQNGTFQDKTPALATFCRQSPLARETLLFGLGTAGDDRYWFTRDHGTGTFDNGFTVITGKTFTDGPAAAASASFSTEGINVVGRTSDFGGQLFSNRISVL